MMSAPTPRDVVWSMWRTRLARSHSAGDRLSILAAAVLWGTTGTAATFAPHGTSAFAVGAAAMGFGGVLLAVVAGRGARVLAADKSRRVILVAGAGCVALYPLAFYTSMAKAGVAVGVTFTIGTSPIAAAVLERIVDGRRLSGRWVMATAVAVVGALLLSSSDSHPAHSTARVIGVGLGIVAGICYAGYSVAAGRLVSLGTTSRAVMGAMFGFAAVALVPVAALAAPALLSTGRGLAVTSYLAVVPMGLGYVLFGRGLRRTPASTATAITLVEPVVAALLAFAIIHQHLTISGWAGVALIAASVAALTRTTPALSSPASTSQAVSRLASPRPDASTA